MTPDAYHVTPPRAFGDSAVPISRSRAATPAHQRPVHRRRRPAPAARVLRARADEDAAHGRAGRAGAPVQPRVLPAGRVQPVADLAADRAPAGHDEDLRP